MPLKAEDVISQKISILKCSGLCYFRPLLSNSLSHQLKETPDLFSFVQISGFEINILNLPLCACRPQHSYNLSQSNTAICSVSLKGERDRAHRLPSTQTPSKPIQKNCSTQMCHFCSRTHFGSSEFLTSIKKQNPPPNQTALSFDTTMRLTWRNEALSF